MALEDIRQEEAGRFARVWQRVMPEGGGAAPIVPVLSEEEQAPAGTAQPPQGEYAALLGREQALREGLRRLWRRTCWEALAGLVRSSEGRSRGLSAAAYLQTGQAPSPSGAWEPAADLSALYQALTEQERRLRTMGAWEQDPVLMEALMDLAGGCRRDRERVLRLAQGQFPR